MITGNLAAVLCASGWNLIHTIEQGKRGVISISIATTDGTPVSFTVRHVKQGNAGTGVTHEDKHNITPLMSIASSGVNITELGVVGLDDIWVNSSVGSKLVVNINTIGTRRAL